MICRHPWLLARPCATNLGLTADRPPTLRVCARPVRATCRPRAQEVSRTASCRLRVVFAYAPTAARWRGLPPAACSAHTTPPSGLPQRYRGRASVMRHARAAAHTLRVAVRSATVTRSSAPVQPISQRGRQRLCGSRDAIIGVRVSFAVFQTIFSFRLPTIIGLFVPRSPKQLTLWTQPKSSVRFNSLRQDPICK